MKEAPSRESRPLCRSGEGRILFGVCAGLGRHTGIDPVVFRVGFAVLLFGSGMGFFLYIAAFMLMKDTRGLPGMIEQWTRRDFDAEAVMALLTAVLGFGLGINLATVWLDTGTLVVGLVIVLALLAAHASGVDLLALARSMPERLSRRQRATPEPMVQQHGRPEPGRAMVDIAFAAEAAAPPYTPRKPYTAEPAHTPAETRQDAADTRHDTTESRQERQDQEDRDDRQDAPVAPQAAESQETTEVPIPYGEELDEPKGTRVLPAAGRTPTREEAMLRVEAIMREKRAARQAADAGASARSHAEAPETPRQPQPPRPAETPRERIPYGEPFAPHGPYQPLDPARRGGYSPYDPALYRGQTPPPAPVTKKRPRSFIGVITVLLSLIIGGIVVAVQSGSAQGVNPAAIGASVLITVGAGLLVAAWWGRGAGLVALGTVVAVVIAFGMIVGGLPKRVGDRTWTPTTLAETSGTYEVGVGEGRLDLSELKMPPGSRAQFNASVSVGELMVIVPASARVEVHATARVGDITIDQSLRGGVDVEFDKVLEPETKPKGAVSTIVLNLRGGMGDVEVRRAA
ncbi:PspC domain-containing protein [Nonomuraea typhae]|uniref:PspC domain-containing protein n=1 Tax=Nonomuraea typhae TaxID=2603600 RepID=UPI0015E25521|nr:PspC domain-containing protein [Nonomuraea typhae]